MSAVGPASNSLSPSSLDRERCVEHAHFRERRAASLEVPLSVDIEGLRERFRFERDRNRLSDDIEVLRKRERERELELERLREEMEGLGMGGRRRYSTKWEDSWDGR
jgi:hypothetical protein